MRNVMEQTDALINAIHGSNEYIQYQMLLNDVRKNESVYQCLNVYRQRNFEIQMKNQIDSIEASARLNQEFQDILTRTDVKEFLAVEQRYLKMIRKMNQKIDSQIHVNIDFM
ncbi:MAG: YlbF family regulator [Lachnospiraceae bacterium]|nr:YlbF family regulator [Lachnospiraceae bacterium]